MQKTIGLLDAIKKSFAILFRNENLGFIAKVAITVAFISSGIVMVSMVIQLFMPSAVSKTLKPLQGWYTTSNNTGPNDSYNYPTTNNGFTNITEVNPTVPSTPPSVNVGSLLFILLVIIVELVIYVLTGMYISTISLLAAVKIFDGQIVSIKALAKEAWVKMLKLAWLNLVISLIVMLGFVLFIIPGIIWAIKYMYAPFIMLRDNAGVSEAMRRSKELTAGYKWDLFLKGVGYTLLIFVAIFPLFIVASTLGAFAGILINVLTTFTLLFILKSLTEIKTPAAIIEPNATTIA